MRQTEDGVNVLGLQRIKKVLDQGLAQRVCTESIHSVVATKNEELIILFDKSDMHIYNMQTATHDPQRSSYEIQDVITHSSMNFRGLQLLEDRYMYMMYN